MANWYEINDRWFFLTRMAKFCCAIKFFWTEGILNNKLYILDVNEISEENKQNLLESTKSCSFYTTTTNARTFPDRSKSTGNMNIY